MKEILRSKTIIGFIVIVVALTMYGSGTKEYINKDKTDNIEVMYNI